MRLLNIVLISVGRILSRTQSSLVLLQFGRHNSQFEIVQFSLQIIIGGCIGYFSLLRFDNHRLLLVLFIFSLSFFCRNRKSSIICSYNFFLLLSKNQCVEHCIEFCNITLRFIQTVFGTVHTLFFGFHIISPFFAKNLLVHTQHRANETDNAYAYLYHNTHKRFCQ